MRARMEGAREGGGMREATGGVRPRGGRDRTCAIRPVDTYISHIISSRDSFILK